MMQHRIATVGIGLALAVAACGGGGETATAASDAGTTTTSAAPTTAAPSTTAAPPTTAATSTTEPVATTTEAPVGDGELAAFVSQIWADNNGVRSVVMSASFAIEGIAEVGSLEFGMDMAADYENELFSMHMDLSSLLAAAPEGEVPQEMADLFTDIEMRSIGDIAYLRFPFFNSFLGVDTEWMSMSAEDANLATDGFGANAPTDPTEMLESFANADADVVEVGDELVNGVDTTHYLIVIDMDQLVSVADPEDVEALEQFGGLPKGEVPIDLWLDGDGLVRKLQVTYSGEGLELAPDESFDSMVFTIDVLDYNAGVVVEAPPADQVTDVSDIAGDMFGDFTA